MKRYCTHLVIAMLMALSSLADAQTNALSRLINQGPIGMGPGFQTSILGPAGPNFQGPFSGLSNSRGPLGGFANAQGPFARGPNSVGALSRQQVFSGIGGGTRFRTSDPLIRSNIGGYFGGDYGGVYGYAPYAGGYPSTNWYPSDMDYLQAGMVPPNLPTDLTSAYPARASRYVDALIEKDGRLLLKWTGDPSTVRKVTFALLDKNRKVIASHTVTRLPIETRFTLTSKTDFYRVEVVYNDGAISSVTKAI